MTTLNRLVIDWSGSSVKGRAVTVLHYSASDNSAPPVAAVRAAFGAAQVCFPGGLQLSFPSAGDQIDDKTGELTGVWSVTPVSGLTMTGELQSAAGVGACIAWNTGGIVVGKKGPRKLRGRTFLVPLSHTQYANDGTIQDGSMGLLTGLAAGIQSAGPLAVWHRPTSAAAADGNSYGVISHNVRDKVAYLSSRRD